MGEKFLIWGGAGGRGGVSTRGDVLVNTTADGVDLNDIWAEIQDVLELWNAERKSITDLISYKTVNVADAIAQSISSDSFEEATELGVPRAIRPPSDVLRLGYSFRDYDISLRATWKFLREATAEQVTAQVTRVFEADNKLTTGTILRRLLDPATQLNEWGHTCYGLWNGDGMVPPPYLGKTFDGNHKHYLTTGSTTLDSGDVEAMIYHVYEHGYGVHPATQFVLIVNPIDFDLSKIASWKAGVDYGGATIPNYDFIPSALMPAWISNETIHGPIPNAEYNGLQVWGSYENAYIIKSQYMPLGYAVVLATGGPNDSANPVGFREHVNPAYQGLRHIPGRGPYPIQESFFARGFGTGTRHRGAAVVAQITTNGSYTAPTIET
ncbi:hypothetical protein [Mycobacterium kiyosense]|uniref:Major capsid protein n=1 Tax=Mycobacterium kiyosense TaxID=2871094 RepID=A0A9P3UW57_9MYCO|nr:hypothetical protein [Mycobacterium kiyosense]GLB83490.1 hypothetical protein SRL2020028_27460 [Mycobacterium kiyosense]GLB94307.1 hypothetical protein SRL2020226_10830 [Mycobacterium kiyosense]GLD32640.1 hypothetical protein Mkiyose1413_45230 [Mycobacterium kiyosense]GLD37215.1 hypothetical protein Mkiyose1595_34350 [Mycobacterium kiyosense]